MEDDFNGNNLNGRRPQWKQPQWKMKSITDDLNRRWPRCAMTQMEDNQNIL